MKKIFFLFFAISVLAVTACKSAPPVVEEKPKVVQEIADENPKVGPEVKVEIPALFSPDLDIVDDNMSIAITVKHPVQIKDWSIQIRRQAGLAAQQQASNTSTQQDDQSAGRQANPERRPRVFFEQSGTGTPPTSWQWNGKNASGDMVQSATDYQFTLSVNDVFDNNTTYEGTISVDVLVKREGNNLRIIVPAILFPANSSDFNLLNADERRANARVMTLIARVLNKFGEYTVTVEGHANPTTKPGTQLRTNEEAGSRNVIGLKPLSEARAKAVVDYLVSNNNIKRDRLSFVGMGGTRTVVNYDDNEENWKNRRVEFLLKK